MAQGKNANIRYMVLDRCFRDRRKKYFIDDLVKACNEELFIMMVLPLQSDKFVQILALCNERQAGLSLW